MSRPRSIRSREVRLTDVDPAGNREQRRAASRRGTCVRCALTTASGICCSSHNALLCHRCYRRTHLVEVCVEGCQQCEREGLPVTTGFGTP